MRLSETQHIANSEIYGHGGRSSAALMPERMASRSLSASFRAALAQSEALDA
jgi:hypothetical protein